MSKSPSLPLAQGYTMVTRNTRKMATEWFRGNDLEEGRRLFEHQTEADEGRSRRLVAVCEDAGQAAAVVAIVSTLKDERDRAVALLRDVVDGEEDEYPVKAIRAFLKEVDHA